MRTRPLYVSSNYQRINYAIKLALTVLAITAVHIFIIEIAPTLAIFANVGIGPVFAWVYILFICCFYMLYLLLKIIFPFQWFWKD